MSGNLFINEFQFDFDLLTPDTENLKEKLGVDFIHYSNDLPAICVKEVSDFGINTLKEIAKIHLNIWNYSKINFLYVTSPVEIHIYNCNEKPFNYRTTQNEDIYYKLKDIEIDSCFYSDKQKLQNIVNIFSKIAIDCGLIWSQKPEYSAKIKLQNRIDQFLVLSLLNTARSLKKDILDEAIIHGLLMRSLFIMYLQDRNAIPSELWEKIGSPHDYLKVLNNKFQAYTLFQEIGEHFNGNVFPVIEGEEDIVTEGHLKLILGCLKNGYIGASQPQLFDDWRIFNFNIIQVELLSEIYENFLNELNPKEKKQSGTFYTPPALVELVLNDVLPEKGTDYKLKILDPACGSGIFLVLSYKRIVNRWQKAHPFEKPGFKKLVEVMRNSIFGVEINPKAIKVAAFSLYLAILDFLDPKDAWYLEEGEKFPYLIRDIESNDENDQNGFNLFRTDTIVENGEFENINYDLIVGNPPFGVKKLEKVIVDYCDKESFPHQFVIPFIHKSTFLTKDGTIGLLFPTKLLTNTTKKYKRFRYWLLKSCYLEKVYNLSIFRQVPEDFGGRLFSSTVVPISILIIRNNIHTEKSETIEYWAPKTFIKSHVAEGIIIDQTDVKYLPREICQNPDSKIWKIAQWGTMSDFYILEKLKNITTIRDYVNGNPQWTFKRGHHTADAGQDKFWPKEQIISTQQIQRYYTPKSALKKPEKQYRSIDERLFNPPYIIIKEGQKEKKFCASFIDYPSNFLGAVYGLNTSLDKNKLPSILCFLNSSFATYYLFMMSSSWGIERERVLLDEVKELPSSFFELKEDINELFFERIEKLIEQQKGIFYSDTRALEEVIDKLVNEILGLTENDQVFISDTIVFTIDLFQEKEKSIAFRPISKTKPETLGYTQMLCNEINRFLISGDLKINAQVYSVDHFTPLCLVALRFCNNQEQSEPVLIDSDKELKQHLKKIDEYSVSKFAQNIYIRKQIRYYDNETIFIVKPNQKRFWTRSLGIEDAQSIINEIATMK